MRIAISTDCWFPQVNGITRTLEATARELQALGHDVFLLTPEHFLSVPLPYQDSLVLAWWPKLARLLREFKPDTVHIATQGPLGVLVRIWASRNRVHYTTAFHTRFPEYANVRFGLPVGPLYKYARLFHGTAPVLVPSQSIGDVLRRYGIANTKIWTRGVDLERFKPRPKCWSSYRRPIQLYVGRVVAEKNVDEFLRLSTDGTKVIAGDGAQLGAARSRYPEVVFLGQLQSDELARWYSEADVFVMPSVLETYGLVVLEALASGLPVAALPSAQMIEQFGNSDVVVFDEDLKVAIASALKIQPRQCRDFATRHSWRRCTEQFMAIIEQDMHDAA